MNNLGLSADAQPNDNFATIPDVPIVSATDRVNPNQVATGTTRGSQVTTGADGYPQVLQGNQKTFGNGFYVAKPGKDVINTTTASDLIFNSNQNVFKIVKTDTVIINADTFPATGATTGLHQTSTTIAHGQSFIPQIVGSILGGGIYQPLPSSSLVVNNGGLGGWIRWDVSVAIDATNLVFAITSYGQNTSASTYGPLTVRYYLLQETAS